MPEPTDLLDALGIAVPPAANRIASFTNKAAAYYCVQTHAGTHPEYSWYEGLNVAKNRVFGGYDVFVGGQQLDNHAAEVTVYPHKLRRRHGPTEEQLWLLDERNLLAIDLTGATQPVGIQLRGNNVAFRHVQDGVAFFSAQEGDFQLAVAACDAQPIQVQDQRVVATGGGFFIAAGRDEAEAAALIREGQRHGTALKQARQQRMQHYLLNTAYLAADDESLTQALRWLTLTTDQLVARQQGDGIYAGLPWFNEYWGRDEFISLPGAALVSGQYEAARQILLTFAQYQQLDKQSKFYGRVPNTVTPGSIDYHTTDGTPRFIVALRVYVQYSGDTALLQQLYPNVEASITGSLLNWVEKGYLLHADNETWMDARDANKTAYTPRGSRANDVQALWYAQLRAGAYFATHMRDVAHAQQWNQLAQQVKTNFARDFRDPHHPYLADRLDQQDRADFTLRPNQLFALDLLDDAAFIRQLLRAVWPALVYPWGVATLDQQDPRFHPYHLAPAAYPKDAAYHQGTVWPWLNGVAMQRLLETGQIETAYQLFVNANDMALTRGVVGGLSENLDAYPHPGQAWPRQTGAYLQAWSNAEQLRVWYQYFLGIRPDVPNQQLTLAPRLPAAIRQLSYHFAVGPAGRVEAAYQAAPTPTHTYTFAGLSITAVVDVSPFEPVRVDVQAGTVLHVTATPQQLTVQLRDPASGQLLAEQTAAPSAARLDEQQQNDAALAGVPFAAPLPLHSHPVMPQPQQ